MPDTVSEELYRLGRDFTELSPENRRGVLKAARGLLEIQRASGSLREGTAGRGEAAGRDGAEGRRTLSAGS